MDTDIAESAVLSFLDEGGAIKKPDSKAGFVYLFRSCKN